MADDESQLQAELLPCGCGGQPGLEHFLMNGERQWRVKCPGCNRMTWHYHVPTLAVSEWQEPKQKAG